MSFNSIGFHPVGATAKGANTKGAPQIQRKIRSESIGATQIKRMSETDDDAQNIDFNKIMNLPYRHIFKQIILSDLQKNIIPASDTHLTFSKYFNQ